MNKLQKSAWVNLLFTTGVGIAAAIGLTVLVKTNAKGIVHVVIFFVVACIAALVMVSLRKRSIEARFDERERFIYGRAKQWAVFAAITFLAFTSFTVFFIVGGRGQVPVWSLPAVFLSTLFIWQFFESAIILVLCMLEEEDG